MNTREKGKIGEDRATEHLLSRGYAVQHRNYRTRHGEIDIIAAAPDGTLVFIEVKSASTGACGNPLYKITPAKQRTIINMAKHYMFQRKIVNRPCRFDVIGVYQGQIDHIQNAFLACY